MVRVVEDSAAREIVLRQADDVLALGGWAGFAAGDATPAPCLGPDGSVHVAGSFQLIVPIEQHRALVERVAQGWAARGYTVAPVTTFPDGGARVSARTADGFVELSLGSGQPPALVLVIVTECYRNP